MIKFSNVLYVVGAAVLTVGSAFAEGPAVPAGSTPAPAANGAAAPQQPGFLGMIVPFALMFAVLYFLMIRPQQKRMKEQQTMLAALKDGDQVLTAAGMLGTIRGQTEKVVDLEIADGVRVKILKSQVTQVVKGSIKDLT